MNYLQKILQSKEFVELFKQGLIDEVALRDYVIKAEFQKRTENPELKKKIIREQLAEELALSPQTISRIVYLKQPKKKKKDTSLTTLLPEITELI